MTKIRYVSIGQKIEQPLGLTGNGLDEGISF